MALKIAIKATKVAKQAKKTQNNTHFRPNSWSLALVCSCLSVWLDSIFVRDLRVNTTIFQGRFVNFFHVQNPTKRKTTTEVSIDI